MAIPITIPRLGWNMEQGVFMGWLKRDGETVRAGEPLFSLEGDKAVQEIEALEGGVLRIAPAAPAEGATVPVGALLGYVASPGERIDFTALAAEAAKQSVAVETRAVPAPVASPSVRRLAREANVDLRQMHGSGLGGRIVEADVLGRHAGAPEKSLPASRGRRPVSPRARRAAANLGVDWTQLQGTGRSGRIRERDILAQAQAGPRAAESRPLTFASPIRRVIAERMLHSLRSTAPVTLTTTADATNLVQLRERLHGGTTVPSYADLIIKLTAAALQVHPLFNSRWEEGKLVTQAEIHIGIAVDVETGLVSPVIRKVQDLTLEEVAIRTRDLIARARSRRLKAEEMQGGTFTVSNLGNFGVDAFTPIINWPEVAILGVGRIHKQPAIVNGEIVPRDILTLSLTFDHCVVDGGPAARFLETIRKCVEAPESVCKLPS